MSKKVFVFIIAFCVLFFSEHSQTPKAEKIHAQEADEIRDQISNRNSSIQNLEDEIAEYQRELETLNQESNSLENTISSINTNVNKVETSIELTQARISQAESELSNLRSSIREQQNRIEANQDLLAQNIKQIDQQESSSLVEIMLNNDNLSDFWDSIDSLTQFQNSLKSQISSLQDLKETIESQQNAAEDQQQELLGYQSNLSQERRVLQNTRAEKATLLEETENEESRYQELLAEKRARKQAFESDLEELQSQLQVALDPSQLPDQRNESLIWPVEGPLTQRFGRTSASGRLYASGTHNGIDIGVPVGTPLRAAASGTIIGVGNTDRTCQYASYGKWVLIRHQNGLTTLYAHMSLANVVEGQTVSQGDIIGNTGNTGYSTGPHLHFTTFASQAVQVGTLQSNACVGATYRLPLAPKNGYLDPMEYLQ